MSAEAPPTLHRSRIDGPKTARVGGARDAAGRFIAGNPGGPGRPPRQTERDYADATAEVCDIAAWKVIVARAVEAAKDGDANARAFLARYVIGPALNERSRPEGEPAVLMTPAQLRAEADRLDPPPEPSASRGRELLQGWMDRIERRG